MQALNGTPFETGYDRSDGADVIATVVGPIARDAYVDKGHSGCGKPSIDKGRLLQLCVGPAFQLRPG